MNNSNKTTIVLVIIVVLAIVAGYFYWPKLKNSFSKNTQNIPVYTENVTESKTKLVPSDFPFYNKLKNSNEFQRTINNLLEYTDFWDSSLSVDQNRIIFENYMNNNGWNPFAVVMGVGDIAITGEKDGVTLNINIQKNSAESTTTKVQVHFSQK